MSDPGGIVVAVLAALAAAGSFGVAAAVQHRQAQLAPRAGALPFRLLAHLARRPLWLAGIALAGAAYGLQALALAFGPLALVAPIVATDLLFALPVAARWSRRPLGARDWLGCVLAAGGVAVFLATSPPSSGRSDAPPRDWMLAFGTVALICVVAVTTGRLGAGAARAAPMATAAGVVFGLTAAVTLSFTRLLRAAGPGASLAHWQPWAMLALGTAGLLLSANAFQAGALAASLPIMDTVEPTSGVLIGTLLFGEHLAASPVGVAVQLTGAAAAFAGITLVSQSAPGAQAATPHGSGDRAHPAQGATASTAGDHSKRPPAGVCK
ncbi:MAG TPA: DMT family transporter [Streptosporangiaceae bacterium]|nr:DMT family transporter [Streptosporangiaceae bacterium]